MTETPLPDTLQDPAGLRSMDFGPLQIRYDDRVLLPRPWTAAQSRWGAELLRTAPDGPVLELCSGAGHIGLLMLALAVREPGPVRSLVCVDAEPAAVELTRLNAAAAGLGELVEVRHARLEEALADDERFAVVVADPPWVPTDETGRYPEDPLTAIDGGDDGLDVARACVALAARHLRPGGSTVVQLGTERQAELLAADPVRGDLVPGEVRVEERGVLLRLDRPA
ncbi:methyltransferase [Nocardioides sp. GCM10027113]|uniref:methyltransferase n=1 Tax=unclassified Nocardioides TaxID=2615069 RepID=UPI0036178DDC